MTTTSKILLIFAVVGAIAGLVTFFGYSPFGKQVIQQTFGSPVGSTFSTQKIASVNINPNGLTNSTSTSILNTDSSARYIVDYGTAACTGLLIASTSVANLAVQAATTSVANLGLQGNTNYALNLTVSTSSSFASLNSTTTMPNNFLGVWPSLTYMTFTFNATDTGACTVGVGYIGS